MNWWDVGVVFKSAGWVWIWRIGSETCKRLEVFVYRYQSTGCSGTGNHEGADEISYRYQNRSFSFSAASAAQNPFLNYFGSFLDSSFTNFIPEDRLPLKLPLRQTVNVEISIVPPSPDPALSLRVRDCFAYPASKHSVWTLLHDGLVGPTMRQSDNHAGMSKWNG